MIKQLLTSLALISAISFTYAETTKILVSPKTGLSQIDIDKTLKASGSISHKKLNKDLNIYVVEVIKGNEKAVANLLNKNKRFKFAEVDQVTKPDFIPNDYYYTSAWHLPLMGLPTAWEYSRGNGIIVAVLDTGVRATHEDLAINILPGWDAQNNTKDSSDINGHGTAVSSTIAAVTNNSLGIASLSGASKILPIRVAYDSTGYAYWSAIANGITYAANNGARVANNSYSSSSSSSIRSAANYLRSKNGLMFVSAGNGTVEKTETLSSDIIVVSATDQSDNKTSWSSWGEYVDLSAPGIDIYVSRWDSDVSYGTGSGTSFSSPITAATAALMMAANPTLPNTQIEQLLFSTAKDIGVAGKDPYYGYGRVDAATAVIAAKNATSYIDNTKPTVSIVSPISGETVSNIIAVDVNYNDNIGVTKLELYVDSILTETDTIMPYGFVWNTTNVTNGTHSITVKAYDAAGNSTLSSAISLKVSNYTVADTTPPTVNITNPTNNTNIGMNVQIRISASDDRGVVQTILYIDGKQVLASNIQNINYRWNTKNVTSGLHTIAVLSSDPAGNSTSKSINITK
jgi:thermitase